MIDSINDLPNTGNEADIEVIKELSLRAFGVAGKGIAMISINPQIILFMKPAGSIAAVTSKAMIVAIAVSVIGSMFLY